MAYDDRDYFREKPKFELAAGLPSGTKSLLIAVICGYLSCLILANETDFTAQAVHQARSLAYHVFILRPDNLIPWAGEFDPAPWKLLTHWLAAPGLFAAVIAALLVYFAGKSVEELFGTRRYLVLFVSLAVVSGLLAGLADPLITRGTPSIIMGPTAAAFGIYATLLWISPDARVIFNWRFRKVFPVLVAVLVGYSIVTALGAKPGVIVTSPTQMLFAVAASAAYMSWLKRAGGMPKVQPAATYEAWQTPEYKEDPAHAREAERARKELQKRLEKEVREKQEIEAILAKISSNGIGALSRREKSKLHAVSKKLKK